MISIVSVGISECKDLASIPCARDDARKVFDTFHDVLSSGFQDHNSICLFDITQEQFICVLKAIMPAIGPNSSLILYFSCHAKTDEYDDLCLLLADGSRDSLRTSRLFDEIKRIEGKVLVILDCCESGHAAYSASSKNVKNNTSILAACGEYGDAKFGSEGSLFAITLCKAVRNIDNRAEEISLTALAKEIDGLGYRGSLVNSGTSQSGNFIIKPSSNLDKEYQDLPNHFLKALEKSNPTTREAMWYSLADMPLKIARPVYTNYFNALNQSTEFYPEPSWLIRRAIGSSLSYFNDLQDISKKLLTSLFWQEHCIGIVALRYRMLENPEIFNFITELIKQKKINKIDAIWMANLYMSDSTKYDPALFYETDLVKTPWGQFELYKTMTKFYNSAPKARKLIETNLENLLINIDQFDCNEKCIKCEYKLSQFICSQKSRGRLPENVKSKFLLSTLYGTWRGQKNMDLKSYFSTTRDDQIRNELSNAFLLPCVEERMALYEYFINNPHKFDSYKMHLQWGLEDEHPWVRRSAIRAFKAINSDDDIILKSIFETDYKNPSFPGLLDVLLECPIDCIEKLKAHIETNNKLFCELHKCDIDSTMPKSK